jgi:TPP-dependent pyruvate/acetoin dehydrogenase alpha subunit
LRRHLVAHGLTDDARDTALDVEIDAEIALAVSEVEGKRPPDRASLFEDVYETLPWHLREEKEESVR